VGNAISDERLEKVKDLVDDFGYLGASKKLGIKKETVRRNIREWKRRHGTQEKPFDEKLIRQLKERYSDAELRRMANGALVLPEHNAVKHSFDGDQITIGALSDTHLGSKYTDTNMLDQAFEEFDKEKVDMITHSGDVHEGLSHRPGHMYECTHLGYSAQLEHSREVFGQWTNTPIYFVDGNHDRWFIKSNGAIIVKELCRDQDNLHFLGHDEGDININGIIIKLWHGEDGSSYAFSYRIQKIVESFTGGEKPNVFLCGHTHKAISIFDRHIHCVSVGAIQKQSKWMRSKRHASHTGFYIIKMGISETGVSWFEPKFYPFYR
jgi:predicted phosphodiesterase